MTTLVDAVSFTAGSGGTGSFVFSKARDSFRTLAQANADGVLSDGATVSYLAQDSLSNPKQREWGHGTYSLAGNSVARTTVLGGVDNGSDTGTSPVNFSHPPIVSLTALAEDIGASIFNELEISGPPTTGNISAGMFAVAKDTTQATGFGNALYVNDNGSIINLTPKFFLNGNTTFHVSTTGSDSNSGLDSLHPWKTLQHAVDTLATNVDANGFNITVRIADGTYAGFAMNGAPQGIGSYYQFLGNVTTPANVIVQEAAGQGACIKISCQPPAPIQIGALTIAPSIANQLGVYLNADYILLYLAKVTFDGTNAGSAAIYAGAQFTDAEGGFDISGSLGGGSVGLSFKGTWGAMAWADTANALITLDGPITLIGTPNWSTAAVVADEPNALVASFITSITGTATGPRFKISNSGLITADGTGNLNFYPGSASGTVTNGTYDGLIYSQGSTPPNGQVPSYTATLPTTVSSSGSQFQYTFDGSGNLYFCYAPNTWAKYTNAAPFDNSGGGASEPIPVIFG